MRSQKYNIAITSIGSGVGQSVIDSIRLSNLPLKTYGFGNNIFAYGSYDCDVIDYIPTIYQENYIDELISKCHQYNIDLIIPGLDDEAMILANNIDKINQAGLKAVVSKAPLLNLVRDKELMCEKLTPIADIFVKSYSLDELKQAISENKNIFPLIAKPRDGFASRGIQIIRNKEDLVKITENHIIQELAIPCDGDYYLKEYLNKIEKGINPQISEISAQYVTNKDGCLIGEMISYNRLNNGVPIEIVPYKNEYVETQMKKLLPELCRLGHRGPLNIQGRLTNKGLKLFEMNARFTGITGLRAIMGFNEVEACIKSWLDIDNNPPLYINYNRFGIRQTANKSISLSSNKKVENVSEIVNNKLLKSKKTIMVTGANGFIGSNLIKELSKNDNFEIYAFARKTDELNKLYSASKNVSVYSIVDFEKGNFNLGNVDILIHCAFARAYKGNNAITDSLEFTNKLFMRAMQQQIPAVINLSTQAVYGTKNLMNANDETTPVNPETVYACAKYNTELMSQNIHRLNNTSIVTSLRLAGVTGVHSEALNSDFISKMIKKVINQEEITLIDGTQVLEFIDVKDVVSAITALINTDLHNWKSVYNVGNINNSLTIKKIVDIIIEKYAQNGGKKLSVKIINDKVNQFIRMNSSLFMNDTNWQPKYKLSDTILDMIKQETKLLCKK